MTNVITVSDLTKTYGQVTAVNHISFSVRKGEIFGFLGPNGAGKTTTSRMLTGVIEPDTGRIVILGHNMMQSPVTAKQLFGVVPETSNAYPDLTAWQNLMFMGELYGLSHNTATEKSKNLLSVFGLSKHAEKKVKSFSKGMKQRLVLAMALIHEPQLLFLDEPTSGLDVASTQTILSMLREMNNRGVTIFLTTHNMDEANSLCHRVGIIKSGDLIAIDSPEKLKDTIGQMHQIEISVDGILSEEKLVHLPGIIRVTRKADKWIISADNQDITIRSLVSLCERENLPIVSINTVKPTLDQVFLQLTGGVSS
ncbi:MAG: ATP-binding cassette domain-containing protein [Methanospirillaceae archaeon]|nr:ATP-binding cassette domain-containing protein [Methanospirillaceae archaeon]